MGHNRDLHKALAKAALDQVLQAELTRFLGPAANAKRNPGIGAQQAITAPCLPRDAISTAPILHAGHEGQDKRNRVRGCDHGQAGQLSRENDGFVPALHQSEREVVDPEVLGPELLGNDQDAHVR